RQAHPRRIGGTGALRWAALRWRTWCCHAGRLVPRDDGSCSDSRKEAGLGLAEGLETPIRLRRRGPTEAGDQRGSAAAVDIQDLRPAPKALVHGHEAPGYVLGAG